MEGNFNHLLLIIIRELTVMKQKAKELEVNLPNTLTPKPFSDFYHDLQTVKTEEFVT